MRKVIFIFLVALLPFALHAQMPNRTDVDAFKVAWITQKLDLSVDDSKIFWPIYNDYQRELSALRKERQRKLISFRKIAEIEDLPDAEIQSLITNELSFKQRELNIEKRYYARFQKALSIKTLAKFLRAQEAFKKELLERFKSRGPKS